MVEYHKHKLENGLEVLLSPNNYLHSASITVGFKYGLFNERNGETGVSHLIEHTVFEGSNKINHKKVKDFLENKMNYYNGETHDEMTIYSFKFFDLSKYEKIFYTLSEMLFDSSFLEDSIKKEKNAVINEVQSKFDSEIQLDATIARAYMFRKPVFTFLGGNPKVIDGLSRETMLDLYSKYYAPNNAVISITGNFNSKDIMSGIKNYFESIEKANAKPKLEVYTGRTAYKNIHLKGFNIYKGQSSLVFGIKLPGAYQIYNKTERGRAAIVYLTDLLSGNLMRVLREKTGLAYSAGAEFHIGMHTGNLMLYTVVNNKDFEEAKSLIFDEIDDIAAGELDKKPLQKAKQELKLNIADLVDDSFDHSQALVRGKLNYGKDINELYRESMKLSLDDLREAAANYLKKEGQDNSVLVTSN